jgi:hypothetical protein
MTEKPLALSDLNGTQPDLIGRVCDGLLAQAFSQDGELVESANILYLHVENIWHRLYFDYGTVFWRVQHEKPENYEASPEGWCFELTDLLPCLGETSASIEAMEFREGENYTVADIQFSSGRLLRLQNLWEGDRT